MKIFLRKILLLSLSVFIIVSSVFAHLISYEPIFSGSYTSSLIDKCDRLDSIQDPKIVLIAGSNFAFGINSKIIEDALHMPVVNMGLHASWGMDTMLNLTKKSINKGDIIILGFEYNLYNEPDANYELVVNTLENNVSLYTRILRPYNAFPIIASYFQYFCDYFKDITENNKHTYSGAYSRSSFNEQGDNVYDRPTFIAENIPEQYLTVNSTTISEDAINYLNQYAKYIRSKNAQIYITFASTNETSFSPNTDLDAFVHYLKNHVNIEIISDPYDYVYPKNYFYDGNGNYHLNNDAIIIRTNLLVNDIISNAKD